MVTPWFLNPAPANENTSLPNRIQLVSSQSFSRRIKRGVSTRRVVGHVARVMRAAELRWVRLVLGLLNTIAIVNSASNKMSENEIGIHRNKEGFCK